MESRDPALLVVIGIGTLGEARGCDPWPWSRKWCAVESCRTNQHDGTKARRWHLQFRMDLSVAVDTEWHGISSRRSHFISAYNARGNRCDWPRSSQTGQDEAAYVRAPTPVIIQNCQ